MFVFSVVSEDDLGEANFDSQTNHVLINLYRTERKFLFKTNADERLLRGFFFIHM